MRNRIAASIAAITRRQAKVALSTSVFVVLVGEGTDSAYSLDLQGRKTGCILGREVRLTFLPCAVSGPKRNQRRGGQKMKCEHTWGICMRGDGKGRHKCRHDENHSGKHECNCRARD